MTNSQSQEPFEKSEDMSYRIKKLVYEAMRVIYSDHDFSLEEINLEHPALEEHGDYSTNIAMRLSKQIGKSPGEIANKITEKITETINEIGKISEGVVEKVEVAGPGFINFYLSKEILAKSISEIVSLGDSFGGSTIGSGKTVVIDYSAPNIAKRFGIGHLRSTIIGQSLYNLYKFLGYETIGDNHLGDWGTQFGKLLYMISTHKDVELNIDNLEKMYVEFHEEAEKNPSIAEMGRVWFKKLEDGDSEAREMWKRCIEISIKEFNDIYKLLDVQIDYAYGESFYEDKMTAVIEDAKKLGICKPSEGALIVDVPGEKTPLMLLKSDSTTTYATRDLATLKYRKETWNPDVVIYEVGGEQALHFVQVFAVAKMLGYVKENAQLVHTRHGLYRWEHGKMRTRKGDTVKLEDILDEAIKRASELGNKETATDVGVGAIKYFDLKHNVTGDIIFDWEKMFELQGDSGPYLQYTYARAKSILRKASGITEVGSEVKDRESGEEKKYSELLSQDSLLLSEEEIALLRYLYRFPEVVEAAASQYSPNVICTYLFELAKRYNNLYNNVSIIGSVNEANLLRLTSATSIVLKNGLNLLGIKALEHM